MLSEGLYTEAVAVRIDFCGTLLRAFRSPCCCSGLYIKLEATTDCFWGPGFRSYSSGSTSVEVERLSLGVFRLKSKG